MTSALALGQPPSRGIDKHSTSSWRARDMAEQQTPLSTAFSSMSSDSIVSRFIADRILNQDGEAGETPRVPIRLGCLGEPVDLQQAGRVAKQPVDYVVSPIFRAGRASLVTGLGASSKSTLLKTLDPGVR